MSARVRVSIVIPTFRRPGLLRRALASALAQTRPAGEILVVDDDGGGGRGAAVLGGRPCSAPEEGQGACSLDALARESGSRVKFVSQPGLGVAAARNRGIEESSGEVTAFLDDDAQASPDWLENLLRCLEETGAAGAGGPALPEWEKEPGWIFRTEKALSYMGAFSLGTERRRLEGPRDFLIGANCAFRREVFERGLRFRPPAWGGRDAFEDADFSRRMAAAFPVYYEPSAMVRHRIPARKLSLLWLAGCAFRNGAQKAAFQGRLSPRGLRDAWGIDGWISAFSASGYAYGRLRAVRS